MIDPKAEHSILASISTVVFGKVSLISRAVYRIIPHIRRHSYKIKETVVYIQLYENFHHEASTKHRKEEATQRRKHHLDEEIVDRGD